MIPISSRDLQVDQKLATTDSSFIYKGEFNGHPVAIKLPNYNGIDSQADIDANFWAEYLAFRKLGEHPNIVNCIGDTEVTIGNNPPVGGLVFEYLKGETIADTINRYNKDNERIPFEEADYMIREIAQGLSHTHENRVIHRDIKPSNVMIDSDKVKIIDYGLAKGGDNNNHIHTTRASGTRNYMSLEVMRDQVYSSKSDTWAFAVSSWEMLFGDIPYPIQTSSQPPIVTLTESPLQFPESYELKGREFRKLKHFFQKSLNPVESYQSVDQMMEQWDKIRK